MNICNIEDDNELNNRLNTRWFPSQSLPPLYDDRPVQTKYTFFQTIEEKQPSITEAHEYKYYSPSTVFNPGNRAPIEFFMNNVDTESILRNQFMALQKSNKASYVPELNSDLYINDLNYTKTYTSTTCATNTCNKNLAPNTFDNFTRYNLRK